MEKADPVAAYHRAAAQSTTDVERAMATGFREAGAEDGLIDTIGTYIHHDGTAYVGIPGSSPHAVDAHEIEYGTPYQAPRSPVRNITGSGADAAEHQSAFGPAFDREMGNELHRAGEVRDYREGDA